MKLLHFTFVKSKYYKEGILISEQEAKSTLNRAQYNWLIKTGKCNIRVKEEVPVVEENKVEKPIKKRKSADEKLLAKFKNEYRTDRVMYKDGMRTELLRANKKGFYNVIGYVNLGDNLDDLILADIKSQKFKKSNKEEKVINEDDEI